MEKKNDDVLLKIEHLCQYFKMGSSELKAVDDVSFDIKKGEVFGLVGESGCGKTTTGRSIIKLYNITSGNIYFKGVRIGAGIRSYQDAIAKKKEEYKEKKKAGISAEEDAKLKKESMRSLRSRKQPSRRQNMTRKTATRNTSSSASKKCRKNMSQCLQRRGQRRRKSCKRSTRMNCARRRIQSLSRRSR